MNFKTTIEYHPSGNICFVVLVVSRFVSETILGEIIAKPPYRVSGEAPDVVTQSAGCGLTDSLARPLHTVTHHRVVYATIIYTPQPINVYSVYLNIMYTVL